MSHTRRPSGSATLIRMAELLSIQQAAAISGRKKKALLALVEQGRLPAVRRQGRWLIARDDLARLPPSQAEAAQAQAAPPDGATLRASAPPAGTRDELVVLLDALRQRDEQIARLQDERAHLTGQ